MTKLIATKHTRPSPEQLITFMRSVKELSHSDEIILREAERQSHWQILPSRQFLVKQGDPISSVYLVLHGKLRYEILDAQGHVSASGDFHPGDLVGDIGLLRNRCAAASVYSIRDTQLLAIDGHLFETLLLKSPSTLLSITKKIIRHADETLTKKKRPHSYSALAMIPLDPEFPIDAFSQALCHALSEFGASTYVTKQRMEAERGSASIHLSPWDAGFAENLSWFSNLAGDHKTVLYQAEYDATPWSLQCLRQADRFILVGPNNGSHHNTPLEELLTQEHRELLPKSELVLLGEKPSPQTRHFLANRIVERHHHISLNRSEDIARLARKLTSRSIGLVLGGGGIRASAQIGLIRALQESGIPIDHVGGTSIGSLIAAMFAKGADTYEMERIIREDVVKANLFNDYTFPFISLVKGRKFSKFLRDLLSELLIEDMPLDYFCATTNLTKGCLDIWDSGSAWQAVRASASLPGILPPFARNGNLYLDGGLLDNLPCDAMRKRGVGQIIAVDVSAPSRPDSDKLFAEMIQDPGTLPSLWSLLSNKISPSRKDITGISDVIVRSMVMGNCEVAERVRSTSDLYIRLPVDRWKMLDFKAASTLVEVGYRYASQEASGWKALLHLAKKSF